jgi:hypothetical protein
VVLFGIEIAKVVLAVAPAVAVVAQLTAAIRT